MAEASLPSIGDLHDDQIVALLRSGAHGTLLMAYFGELGTASCRSSRSSRSRVAIRAAARVRPARDHGIAPRHGCPPQLFAAVAASDGARERRADAARHPGPAALRAVGVMLPGYLKLRLRLEIAGFRPLFCPFDWRRTSSAWRARSRR